MPQEFFVLRCVNCEKFQVHQVKKSKRWECKVCGEKQSMRKTYFIGTSKDCRIRVQTFNFEDGERKMLQTLNTSAEKLQNEESSFYANHDLEIASNDEDESAEWLNFNPIQSHKHHGAQFLKFGNSSLCIEESNANNNVGGFNKENVAESNGSTKKINLFSHLKRHHSEENNENKGVLSNGDVHDTASSIQPEVSNQCLTVQSTNNSEHFKISSDSFGFPSNASISFPKNHGFQMILNAAKKLKKFDSL